MKKKEKKYFEYITIKKPTFRLIAEILMKQPAKILGMRMDTLAQLTTLANVHAGGNLKTHSSMHLKSFHISIYFFLQGHTCFTRLDALV